MSDAHRRSLLLAASEAGGMTSNNNNNGGQAYYGRNGIDETISSPPALLRPSPQVPMPPQPQYQNLGNQNNNLYATSGSLSSNQMNEDVIVGKPMPGLTASNNHQQQLGNGAGVYSNAITNAQPQRPQQGNNNNINNYMTSNRLIVIGHNCYSMAGTAVKLIGPANMCNVNNNNNINKDEAADTEAVLKSLMAKLAQVLPSAQKTNHQHPPRPQPPPEQEQSIWESALESIPILGKLIKDNTSSSK